MYCQEVTNALTGCSVCGTMRGKRVCMCVLAANDMGGKEANMKIYDLINKDIVCTCGRVHRCDIGTLRIGEHMLDRLPEDLAGYHNILLVADGNTYPLCGETVKSKLGDRVEAVHVFKGEGVLVPDEQAIAALGQCVGAETDLILGVGSGVINDLCKYVSFGHGLPCGIVATAPSMDGFASSGAAMILGGMKVTVTTHAPDVIVGDVSVLRQAPMEMIRAGYADIIGKYSSLCDWRLAEEVNGEYLCLFVYDLVKKSTDEIRDSAADIAARDAAAIGRLMECLVLIGVCLTLLSTTRPGSGSEHHLSHFFEITGLIEHKPYFLHGIDVGYATEVTARLREEILRVSSPVCHTAQRETHLACYRAIYGRYADEVCRLQDKAGWYEKPLAAVYAAHWERICTILAECPPAREIRAMLEAVGFDMSAFERMYGARKIQNSIWFGKDLKDRYSVLWLYFALFFDEREAEGIYETGEL